MSETTTTDAPPPVIWIVDDSPTHRAVTQRALGEGFVFEQFSDGSEVVERLASGALLPDVLLLDWVMPGMSGDAVCKFLRANTRTRSLPIIMVTASRIETTDVVEGLALGANDYVARPFAPEELRARVNSVLRTKELNDVSVRERMRLAAINRLSRALFEVGPHAQEIAEELADTLTSAICDGCSILLLPGELPSVSASRHHADPSGEALAAIASVADPATHTFDTVHHALSVLPPAYHPYIRRFGLRSLAILPFPIRAPVQGVVTVTRDGSSQPLAPDDLATIETCIEYASLALQSATRFDAERSARAQLDAILAHAPIGIIVADPDGMVRLANPVAIALMPALARPTLLSDALPGVSHNGLERARRTRQPATAELTLPGEAEGSKRYIAVSMMPLRVGDEEIGSVLTLQDVTSQREFAAERERIAQFQEQMLGIVGHDLRSPLGAIVAGLELVELRGAEVPEIGSVSKLIRSSASRMSKIVSQLLDVTRARLGPGIPLVRHEISLDLLVRAVLDELALAHPQATFELSCSTEVVGVWDPDRLGQVISNLASNAIQYGKPGAPIRVRVEAADEDTAVVSVSNANRGEPIPPERVAMLFEPYRRGGEGEHHAGGLGLGLFIAKEIVVAHQGRISAESELDQTTFRVELPRRR